MPVRSPSRVKSGGSSAEEHRRCLWSRTQQQWEPVEHHHHDNQCSNKNTNVAVELVLLMRSLHSSRTQRCLASDHIHECAHPNRWPGWRHGVSGSRWRRTCWHQSRESGLVLPAGWYTSRDLPWNQKGDVLDCPSLCRVNRAGNQTGKRTSEGLWFYTNTWFSWPLLAPAWTRSSSVVSRSQLAAY